MRSRITIQVLGITLIGLLSPEASFAGKERAVAQAISRVIVLRPRVPFQAPPLRHFSPTNLPAQSTSSPPVPKVKIAVVEQGFGYHRLLKDKVVEPTGLRQLNETQGRMFRSTIRMGSPVLNRVKDHGVAVIGLASRGISTIEVLPVSAFTNFKGLRYACEKGVSVVNISLRLPYPPLVEELKELVQEYPNVLFNVAAGNDGKNHDFDSPYDSSLSFPNLLFVAATKNHPNTIGDFPPPTDPSVELAGFSDYGSNSVHVATVGQDLPLLQADDGAAIGQGTSFSAPMISNLCVKLELINPALTAKEKVQILKETLVRTPALQKKLIWGGVAHEENALKLATLRKAVTDRSEKILATERKPELSLSQGSSSSSAR